MTASEPEASESIAEEAGSRVARIVAAAEATAAEIVADARADAERIVERARTDARERIAQAEDAVSELVSQAGELRGAIDRLAAESEPGVEPQPVTAPEPEPAVEPEPEPVGVPEPEPYPAEEPSPASVPEPQPGDRADAAGARLVAMKMALEGATEPEIVARISADFPATGSSEELVAEVLAKAGR